MSHLNEHLDNYLTLRRQLGFKLHSEEILLRGFVRYAGTKRVPFITTRLVVSWAIQPPGIKRATRAQRLGVVRKFAQYLHSLDHRTEIPSRKLLPWRTRRQTPYFYRNGQIRRLVEAARQIDSSNEFKGVAYSTTLGFLAVTGMRINEALQLDRDDVDLKQGLVTVRRAKGNKSRLVPLHLSTQKALRKYIELRDRCFRRPRTSAFFVSEQGTRQNGNTVRRWFRLVAHKIGLRKAVDGRGPRVHDLRHHFAIQTLLRWYRMHADVELRLPELSTYLGHVHVNDTYWYLSAVPELLKLATQRLHPREVAR
jgi:integrase/recombinase XerD